MRRRSKRVSPQSSEYLNCSERVNVMELHWYLQCLCILVPEPIESFREQSKCEHVGSDNEDFATKSEFVLK